MEGFNIERSIPESESNSEKNVYAEINRELREIIRNSMSIPKEARRSLFDRMIQGPELTSTDPEVASFFEQIADIEEKYGKEHVAEVAAFYVHPEPTA
jgi:hypothetical protein